MYSWCRLAVSQLNEGCVLLECCKSIGGISEEYRIVAVNKAFEKLTGIQADQCINIFVSDLSPESEPLVHEAIRSARINETSVFGYHSKQLDKYFEVTCCRQSADHFILIANDLTVCRKAELMVGKAEEVVNSLEKAKYNFLSTMSHEARTPLNGILGMLELLKETQLTSNQKELLLFAEEASQRLNAFITNVLEYTMAGSKMITCQRPMNIRNVFRAVVEESRSICKDSPVTLSSWIDPMIPMTIIGDECIIRKILFKLVDNAIKYTGTGSITLEASMTTCTESLFRVLFSVADNGIGIADDKIDHVFQPFAQASEGLAREHEGAGLGLAICKQLVELLNGSMAVETCLGAGTTFHICLPFELCHQMILADNEPRLSSILEGNVGHGKTVLSETNHSCTGPSNSLKQV